MFLEILKKGVRKSFYLFITRKSLTLYSFIDKNRSFSNQDPKGPINWPFFGVLLRLGEKPHLTYQKWNRQYGGIIKIWLGKNYSMIVSDPVIMKEIWVKDFKTFADRPKFPTLRKFSFGFQDLAMVDYESWKGRRELVANYFTRGKLKNSIPIIDSNAENLIRLMKPYATSKQPKYALNIVLNYVFSTNIPFDEDINGGYLKRLDTPVNDVIGLLTTGALMDYITILEWIYNIKDKYTSHGFDVLYQIMKEIYEKHEENLDVENPKDIVDYLIINLKENEGENKKNIIILMSLNMFLAGFDTSTSALEWLCYTCANYQDVQERVYKELSEVAAGTGKITLANRTQTPYLNAVLKEILRYRTLIPLGVPRVAREDAIVCGYYIPKGVSSDQP
ncbi:hypothetical protein PPL_04072 [Heterostelium album PN500]|uniref:Cytochrome P450 n=1 Tax=Heterostelium pallidum (strain ATCC 26659 / Pp 5 / PN500) TaxID=670386 RepID=D3B5Y4_HETP5|nr:hypothetical protein PPL_04072 [Heterostelium album PN500]EFA83282.1 hypothetical protein PPL_04072 [Heterostelium album PN500]|eukprot:XP_020435399.1 hypothetical protein PPL_04072 [Heterostelium album PN500]